MPHRTQTYRRFCAEPTPVTRTELRNKWSLFHNPLFCLDEDDDYDAEWDKIKDEMEEVEVPVLDDAGQPIVRACGKPATTSCGRCNRPWCDDHDRLPGFRCEQCELEWARRDTGLRKLSSGLGWVCVSSFFGMVGLPIFVGWTGAVAAAGVGVAALVALDKLESVDRRRFMAEFHPRFQ